uniref:Uncharacterized protein n=1 Tax=Manihot esculenta TaxID=3983 RepID=A0A2C9U2H4_MANES
MIQLSVTAPLSFCQYLCISARSISLFFFLFMKTRQERVLFFWCLFSVSACNEPI